MLQSLIVRPFVLGMPSSPELEDRDKTQNEDPLLCLTATKYSEGTDKREIGKLLFASKMGLIAQSCLQRAAMQRLRTDG